MNKNILITILVSVFLFSLVSASLGTFAQGDCVSIRVLSNYSEVNLTTITLDNATTVINSPMTNLAGITFNYTYCNTTNVGNYVYDWYPCADLSCVNDFTIGTNLTIPIFLLIFSAVILILGFIFKSPPVGFFSGLLFTISGIYIMIYGLGFIFNLYTQIFALIVLSFGLIMMFLGVFSMFEGSKNEEAE